MTPEQLTERTPPQPLGETRSDRNADRGRHTGQTPKEEKNII